LLLPLLHQLPQLLLQQQQQQQLQRPCCLSQAGRVLAGPWLSPGQAWLPQPLHRQTHVLPQQQPLLPLLLPPPSP
jgi:hypothetical protein